jgi:hypothetical protein
VLLHQLHDATGDQHQVGDAELHGRDRARVEAAAEAADALARGNWPFTRTRTKSESSP